MAGNTWLDFNAPKNHEAKRNENGGLKEPIITEVGYKTWCINELGCNNMYVLEGTDRAAVIDAGMGYCNFRKIVEPTGAKFVPVPSWMASNAPQNENKEDGDGDSVAAVVPFLFLNEAGAYIDTVLDVLKEDRPDAILHDFAGIAGTMAADVYGRGNESKSLSNTSVNIQNKAVVNGNVYGGGNHAEVSGATHVQIGKQIF